MAEAEHSVRQGDLWGYIHFVSNYSQHMIDRLATKQFALEESIDGSTISLRMDMSGKYLVINTAVSSNIKQVSVTNHYIFSTEYLGSVLIIQHMYEGLQKYIRNLIASCDLEARQVDIPLEVNLTTVS